MFTMLKPIEVKPIFSELLKNKSIQMDVALLDSIHPLFGGNKWFKLKYNLEEAKRRNAKAIVTFGGAYSNHIYATAAACQVFGIPCIGLIRGEAADINNSTLSKAKAFGMEIDFLSRMDYAEKETELFEYELHEKYGNVYIIPEGGANFFGINGSMEILKSLNHDYDTIAVSCGTATTLTGIVLSAQPNQKIVGFAPMKGGVYLKETVQYNLNNFLGSKAAAEELIQNVTVIDDYHFGGFAKVNDDLRKEKLKLEQSFGFELDYVYTAKMFYGLLDMIEKGLLLGNQKMLVIHTGGLQGNAGFQHIQ
jgi:1-aminocyclopropane-1-carboxylate deaminase